MAAPIDFHTPWRKSSFSGEEVNCVEVAGWRKSSFSSEQVNCVEVAHGAGVRDSKSPEAGHLTLHPTAYRGLVAFARRAH